MNYDSDSDLLLALLSNLSARSSPYLSSLTICGGVTIMALESLSPRQCTSLFEHLSTLRLDSFDAPEWLEWIGPYCSRIETIGFTISPSTYKSGMLSPLPVTTQCLNFQIRGADLPVHLAHVRLWAGDLLEIARSTLHSALKLIRFKVPCAVPMTGNYFTEVRESIDSYEAGMRGFLDEMNAVCGEAKIIFEFSWAEQCEIQLS